MKSILIFHLNHSNWIRNKQVMAKIRKLVKTRKQNSRCTGTCLTCTGTCWPKTTRTQDVPVQVQNVSVQVTRNAQNVCFSPHFSIFLIPNSTLYFKHTSKPFHISLVTSIILNSSFNTYLKSKTYHDLLSNPLLYGF